MIPYGKHHIDNEDIEAVVSVLKSGQITQGPKMHVLSFIKQNKENL